MCEEKKKKIVQELQLSNLKETFTQSQTLQATEDASKWNEALNPMLFALVHKCWFDPEVRKINNLPEVTEEQKTFEMISRMGFYYLLIKRIHLGEGFIMENDIFYTRVPWPEVRMCMLNKRNQEWFSDPNIEIDSEGYIAASPGFLMGMLNAASTTIGLIAVSGIDLKNTVLRSLRSSDDSMTIFVSDTKSGLCTLIQITYNVYRLFGINPSKEKTILFPEGYGEYTSWYQDKEFVGQYGVETSSLKPGGKNPQDDFNGIAANTLQLLRTNIINSLGAIARISIGVDNVRSLWNIKDRCTTHKKISDGVIFLSDGGKNPWVIENVACDETTIRFKNLENDTDREYFYKIMDPGNPFSEPPEKQLLFSKDIGILVSREDDTPRNVFCFIRKSNNTNRNKTSKTDADIEKHNQEAFNIATAVDPSFLLSIPNSKAPLNKYLLTNIMLMRERVRNDLSQRELKEVDEAILRLNRVDDVDIASEGLIDDEACDRL